MYPRIPLPSELKTYVPPPEFMDNSLMDPTEIPEKGTKFTLIIKSKEDLERVVLHSDTSFLVIPTVELEEADGTGFFGTIRDKLVLTAHKLENSKSFYSLGSEQYFKVCSLIEEIYTIVNEQKFDMKITLYDPISSSFISSPPNYADDQYDENLAIIRVARSFEEEKELGFDDKYYPDETFITYDQEDDSDENGERKSNDELTTIAINEFVNLINKSERVCILSGAGISTESNIPAYRSISAVNAKNDNLWDNFDEKDENISNFLRFEDTRLRYWQRNKYFKEIIEKAKPNPSHFLAKKLQEKGKLLKVITQNIDGLYFEAEVAEEKVIQVHGTCRKIHCLTCGKNYNVEETYKRFDEEKKAPVCTNEQCSGLLKPATVSFGQPIDPNVLKECKNVMEECDLLVVMGSSLVVKPVNVFPGIPIVRKVPVVIMNYGDTKYDPFSTILFDRQKCGELSEKIIALIEK